MVSTAKKSTPAKKAPAKRAPAKKAAPPRASEADDGSAAEAAVAELELENETILVPFRGVEFAVDPAARRSGRYAIALASQQYHIAIVELIDAQQIPRFISLCKRGEELADVAGEFFDALGEASSQGNS